MIESSSPDHFLLGLFVINKSSQRRRKCDRFMLKLKPQLQNTMISLYIILHIKAWITYLYFVEQYAVMMSLAHLLKLYKRGNYDIKKNNLWAVF